MDPGACSRAVICCRDANMLFDVLLLGTWGIKMKHSFGQPLQMRWKCTGGVCDCAPHPSSVSWHWWPKHQSGSLSPSHHSPPRPRHGNPSPQMSLPAHGWLSRLPPMAQNGITLPRKVAKASDHSTYMVPSSARNHSRAFFTLALWARTASCHVGFPASLICRWATGGTWFLPVAFFPSRPKVTLF